MQQLTNKEIEYFSDFKNWLSGPSFHAVFIQEKNTSVGRFADVLVLDKSIRPWKNRSNLSVTQRVSHCIIFDSILNHPFGAKIFEREYENYLFSYVSVPPDHVGRICGQRWVYGQYDLDQMVAFHTVLINLTNRIRKICRFSVVVLMDEAWSWPAKLENLREGILVNHQIALHAGWASKAILPTNYALIPFSNED